jgi:hypothetical protein
LGVAVVVASFPGAALVASYFVVAVKAVVLVAVKLVIAALIIPAVVAVSGFPAGALLGRYAVVAVIPIVVVAAAWAIVAGNGSGTSAGSGEKNGGSEASERSFHGVNYLRVNLLSYQQRRGNYPFANARPETWPPRVLSPLSRSNPDQRQHNADWQT